MTQWLGHFVLHSLGLFLVAVLVILVRLVFRRDPISSYRFLIMLVIATLVLPVLQMGIQGRIAAPGGRAGEFLARLWFVEDEGAAGAPVVTPRAVEEVLALRPTAAPSCDPVWEILDRDFPESPGLVIGPAARPDPILDPDFPGESLSAIRETELDAWEDEPSDERAVTLPSIKVPEGYDWSRLERQELLLAAYLLGVLLLLQHQVRRHVATRRLLARASCAVHPEVQEIFLRIAAEHGLSTRVRLCVSHEVESPACWGLFRPVLVLPLVDAIRPPQPSLEWAMRHELVHIARGDARTVVLQS
ncbi:MAG: hypothetical protein KDB53_03635, partial [Planctomycetes bacterium]|nr:hypothetical protein [Planctomycetota bacterium]